MPTTEETVEVASRTATIANGETTSGAVNLNGRVLCGLHMPAAFTGATVTFSGSEYVDGTFRTVYSDGADLSVTVSAGKYVVLDPADFAGINFLKVISASAEGAARSIVLGVKAVS